MAIGDDFTIDYTNKRIYHSANTTIYTVNAFYSWLMNTFDDLVQMDDDVPISAQTPTEYTMINGWFLDDDSIKYLKTGAIQTSGWGSGEIMHLHLNATKTSGTATGGSVTTLIDSGKDFEALGVEVGDLIFDNTNYETRAVTEVTNATTLTVATGTTLTGVTYSINTYGVTQASDLGKKVVGGTTGDTGTLLASQLTDSAEWEWYVRAEVAGPANDAFDDPDEEYMVVSAEAPGEAGTGPLDIIITNGFTNVAVGDPIYNATQGIMTRVDTRSDASNITVFDTTGGDTHAQNDVFYICDTASGNGVASKIAPDGETLWANVYTLGTIATDPAPLIYIKRGDSEVIDGYIFLNTREDGNNWWNTDHIDVLLKVKDADILKNNAEVTVYGRQFGDLYDQFTIDLSAGGRNAVPLATSTDLDNSAGSHYLLFDGMTGAGGSAFVSGEIIDNGGTFRAEVTGVTYEYNTVAATTSAHATDLTDSLANFVSGTTVSVGDIVKNTTAGTTGTVSSITSTTVVVTDIAWSSGDAYSIYSVDGILQLSNVITGDLANNDTLSDSGVVTRGLANGLLGDTTLTFTESVAMSGTITGGTSNATRDFIAQNADATRMILKVPTTGADANDYIAYQDTEGLTGTSGSGTATSASSTLVSGFTDILIYFVNQEIVVSDGTQWSVYDVMTGATSGATGTVIRINGDVITLGNRNALWFQDDETLTGQTGSPTTLLNAYSTSTIKKAFTQGSLYSYKVMVDCVGRRLSEVYEYFKFITQDGSSFILYRTTDDALNTVKVYDSTGATYTSYLTEANDLTTTNGISYFDADPEAGDFVYFSGEETYAKVKNYLGTAGNGFWWFDYEYWNGAWTSFGSQGVSGKPNHSGTMDAVSTGLNTISIGATALAVYGGERGTNNSHFNNTTAPVVAGDLVWNITQSVMCKVVSVDSDTQITTDNSVTHASTNTFVIAKPSFQYMASGKAYITFETPADWALTTVDGVEGYFMRANLLYYGSSTTLPLGDYHQLYGPQPQVEGQMYSEAHFGYVPVKASPFGTFAGGTYFGARGVWVENMHTADVQAFQLKDGDNTTRNPPNFQSITITNLLAYDRVSVFRTAGGNIDKTQYTSHASNNTASAGTFETQEAIPSDTPSSGILRTVNASGQDQERLHYGSWLGSIFTLDGQSKSTDVTVNNGQAFYVTGGAAKYFQMQNGAGADFYVWISIDGVETDPAGTGTGIEVTALSSDTTATLIAAAIATDVGLNANFSASSSGDVVTITNAAVGVCTDTVDVDANVVPNIIAQGIEATLGQTYDNTDTAYVPYLDEISIASSSSVSVIYNTDQAVVVRVRRYTATAILPFETSGTYTATGYSVGAIRTTDAIIN